MGLVQERQKQEQYLNDSERSQKNDWVQPAQNQREPTTKIAIKELKASYFDQLILLRGEKWA